MKLLTIIFSFLSFATLAQTGAINFSVGRSKVTDTSTVVMTGYKGGIRFKDQAGQTKWQFTVNGTSWLDWLASNDGLTTNYIPKAISANVLGNSQIFDNGTRVGIGTASPQEKFHIVGVRASQIIEDSGTPADASLFLGTTSNRQYSGFIADFPNDKFYLRHNSATRVTINSTGNLGIGTTSPLERLHITGARASQYIEETNGSPVDASLFLGTTSNRQYSGFITDFPNDKFYLRHNSATRMTVDLSGNFGIGTTSPAQKLDVNGTFAVRGGSPGSGKVLTSDADGDASWTTPPTVSGTSGQVTYFNGTNSVTSESGFTYDAGTNTLTVPDIVSSANLYTNNTADRIAITATSGRITTDSDLTYDAANNIFTARRYKIGATPVANAVLYMDSGGEFLYQSGFTFNAGTNTLSVLNISNTDLNIFSTTGAAIFGSSSGDVTLSTAGGNMTFSISGGDYYRFVNVPTSSAGLPSGALWNDSGTLKLVP